MRPDRLRCLWRVLFFFVLPTLALLLDARTSCGDQLGDLTRPIAGRPERASSGLFDPESNRDAHHVEDGQRFILADLDGPGEVRHLWFTIAGTDRRYARTLVLRVYYDHAKVPSVETPIGDFFAAGNGMRATVSTMPIEVSSYGRALNCYWRMPFKRHCRIEVHNQGRQRMTVYFQCDWLKLARLPEDVHYFHARYRQEYPPKPFSAYTIFEGRGEGHYVGSVVSWENVVGSWYGEADDRFYVDGEPEPSLIGTGTEDYFNDAWNVRLTSHQRVGTTICEPKGDERRITSYRWHIDDPVPFKRSLKVELERRSFVAVTDPATGQQVTHDFKFRPDYCSSVAFWYQKGIAEPAWPLAPVEERVLPEVWLEPTGLIDRVQTSPGVQPRVAANRTCNLKQGFFMRNDRTGSWVEFPVTLPKSGRWAVSVFQNLFKHHGIWKVSLRPREETGKGEAVLAPALDFWDYLLSRQENWPENYEHGTTLETKIGVHRLAAGDYWLRFTCVGANPLTQHPETGQFGQGFGIGLDAICLRLLPIDDPYQWVQAYLKQEEALFASYQEEARRQVDALAEAVEAFRRKQAHYPAALDELAVAPIPLDPWRQPYAYRTPGVVHPWGFDAWSLHGCARDPDGWIGNWKSPLKLTDEASPGDAVLEGERLRVTRANQGSRGIVQRVSSYGNGPISDGAILFLQFRRQGDWAEMELPADIRAGRYEVYLYLATSWDYGMCRWTLSGQPLGDPVDAHSPTIGLKVLCAGTVDLPAGLPVLRAEVIGKSDLSTGCLAGLDAIVLRRVR